ncbi:hypothetical protein Aph02nite_48450 [Actinoplanes philippinensis]|uniref:Uncharacterized protein n=1 Tax=Actinoplanes philippinensis TaxID=35752 RepID=A0A1I2HWR7_9ACTN|nr:hypothetical protein [Actinoplanes philippinensis]GIE78895.1 hypothetical protein Aph02nite_48450 [Actinoplanes philippinensis]SFF34459.1 hypothetical protein SAMN05421541_10942 [Actinoplanes philippinensis]
MRSPARQLLAAVSAAAGLVLVPAPVAAHDRGPVRGFQVPGPSPRPDLKGKRLRCDGGPATFLIDPEGYRRGIPTAAVGTKLFADTVKVEFKGCDSIPLAGYFSQDAYLARLSGTFDLFLVTNGVRYAIADAATFDAFHFDWDKVIVLSVGELRRIPLAATWRI